MASTIIGYSNDSEDCGRDVKEVNGRDVKAVSRHHYRITHIHLGAVRYANRGFLCESGS